MILEQYYIDCLSHASYLIGDESTGRAVVVDPRRDIAEYLDEAEARGLTIEAVINTHFHADFVSGHLELVEATGAWIGYGVGAETDYPVRLLADGETISLGEVELEIVATPGHTWESISVLVREHPGAVPAAVLTGDSLFIGDVGRPDLVNLGEGSAEDLARAMFRTVHDKLLTLPDEVTVMPAHGHGSSCGKNLSEELTSTIGEQRRTNYAAQPMSEDEFVRLVTDGQPAAPTYFAVNAGMNKAMRAIYASERDLPELTGAQLRAELEAGTRILDTRTIDDFAAGHLPGTVNVGFDGRFAETSGMVAEIGEPVALITYPGEEQMAALRMARIGSDNAIGFVNVRADGVFPDEVADLVTPTPQTTARELTALIDADAVTVVDIRNPGEREDGVIPGALAQPLAQLQVHIGDLPAGRPIVVYCAGGWRSSVAASLLRAEGRADVSDLVGGYQAWMDAQTPVPAAAAH